MARVFISGSTDGLGLAAARQLIGQGHQVIGHARSETRARQLQELVPTIETVLVGDLSRARQTTSLADQGNDLGRFDAVIHNAGVGYREKRRADTGEGHAHVLAVNVLAPYLLTALMTPPGRLVYLSSGMHRGGDARLSDIDWTDRRWDGAQAYSDSKLFDAALAAAMARRWPSVLSNAVEPGWVPTKMGGPGAPDDLDQAHLTQTWLAVSTEPAAMVSGRYFYHQALRAPSPVVDDPAFHDVLLARLADLTGVALPAPLSADDVLDDEARSV